MRSLGAGGRCLVAVEECGGVRGCNISSRCYEATIVSVRVTSGGSYARRYYKAT